MKLTNMRRLFISPIVALLLMLVGCSDKLESGKEYTALSLGDTTIIFKVDQVLQNDVDIKPYFSFFDGIEMTLSYKDGNPDKLTFTEKGAPFRVTSMVYEDFYEAEWEINSTKSPYEIRKKGTNELLGHITRDRVIVFTFKLGCEENVYQYLLREVASE